MVKARDGHPTAMLTLTVSSKNYDTPHDAARDLKRGLVALRKRIARAFPGERLPFIAVFEAHKSGWPHLHLLIRARFLPVRRLRDMWEGITGSWNVNIRAIDSSAQAMLYVAKYIGKDVHAFEGCKRWWRSHDYDAETREEKRERARAHSWSRWQAEIGPLRSALRALGCVVVEDRDGGIEWRAPPGRLVTFGEAAQLANMWFPSKRALRRGGRSE